ncbi:hypothetical protein [Agromyces sp. NBRC 114283]|uniref:hypothetical protein n=1 Tax=Agromyces sp. NBRC 114283 TaxID=2994521 RepID=UPI0024A41408|nr:hypothetical protein [Agromyces sp. NBRC 114283]GLU91336.1 hypothetical protein Agsp01_35910 [Agromyces sp. NBRC 114283]
MQFWDYVWSTVIALLVVALITWVVAVLWGQLTRAIGKRPDWVLEWKTAQWHLRRARRSEALDVVAWIGNENGENVAPGNWHPFGAGPDVPGGASTVIHELRGNRTFMISWIDGRRKSAEVELEEGVKKYLLHAEPAPRRRLRFTY